MLQYLGTGLKSYFPGVLLVCIPWIAETPHVLCWAEAVRKSQGFGGNAGWCYRTHEVSKQRAPHLQGNSPRVCSLCAFWHPLRKAQDQLLLSHFLALITSLLLTGVSYSDPGGFKFNRDQLAATDSFSRLPEPAFGEYSVTGLELRENKGSVELVACWLFWSLKSPLCHNSLRQLLLIDFSRKENGNLDQVSLLFKDQHRKLGNMLLYICKLQP